VAKHCSHIVLNVFNELRPHIHLLTTKTGSHKVAVLQCKQKADQHDGTDLTTLNLHRNNKLETMYSDAAQNNSAANKSTNTTTLRIIIDFAS
jgi:hypothetical protein